MFKTQTYYQTERKSNLMSIIKICTSEFASHKGQRRYNPWLNLVHYYDLIIVIMITFIIIKY